jgi:XisI protein
METMIDYRKAVRDSVAQYARWVTRKQITGELTCDDARGHYDVISVGWDNDRRVHHVVVHVDIIDGKVWIQHDATDRPIARMLVEAGVPKSDIVLGFQPPDLRAMGEYAVG